MQKVELNKYDNYKDSKVEWLGEIPEEWEITRVKNVFKLIIKPAPKNNDLELLSVYTDIGVKPRRELEERGNKASTTDGYWMVKKGDIIVNKLLAWMGAIGVSKYDGVTSPAYDILRAKVKIESDFYHYLFRNKGCLSELKKHSRGIMDMRLRLYFDKFGDVVIPFPKYEIQQRIVKFLDEKCGKIDQAIAQKQKLIEILKERKQILIQNAVTKGLDPNVKMKDSGVEWIGEIPVDWEVKKLKYFINVQGGFAFDSSDFVEEGVQIIKIANTYMNQLCLDRQPTFVHESYLDSHKQWIVKNGDILMSLTGTLGKKDYGFAILIEGDNKYLLNQRVAKITIKNELQTKYLLTLLRSDCYLNQLYSLPAGTKQANLSNDNVTNVRVPIPSLKEREQIFIYIETQSTKIDKAITLQQQQIEKLKEYKASLINSAVMGKIKVC